METIAKAEEMYRQACLYRLVDRHLLAGVIASAGFFFSVVDALRINSRAFSAHTQPRRQP